MSFDFLWDGMGWDGRGEEPERERTSGRGKEKAAEKMNVENVERERRWTDLSRTKPIDRAVDLAEAVKLIQEVAGLNLLLALMEPKETHPSNEKVARLHEDTRKRRFLSNDSYLQLILQ